MSLQGKVAVITGASGGIGAAIAKLFSKEKATIVITARNETNLKTVADECPGGPADVHIVAGDVTDETVQKKVIDEAVQRYGGIDILINNAGMGMVTPVDVGDAEKAAAGGIVAGLSISDDKKFGVEAFDKQFNINVRSVVGITALAIPHIVKRKGNIINISSVAGKHAVDRMSFYCMSKAAIDMLTACLCVELGPLGVRVNAINPGAIKTNFADGLGVPKEQQKGATEAYAQRHALKRVGEAEEVAEGALFLASQRASFVTGSSLFVDGGIMHMM